MAAPEDEDAIEALPTQDSHEPFRERIGPRRSDRRPYYLGSLGGEHLVEGAPVFGIAVPDEEAERKAIPSADEVASLLGHPGGIGVGGHAGEMHPAGGDLDEQEHIETTKEDC